MPSFEGKFESRDLRSKMNKEQLAKQEAIYKAAVAAEKARREQEKAKEEAEVASAVKGGGLDLRALHAQLADEEAAEKRAKVSGINEQIKQTGNVQGGRGQEKIAPWREGYSEVVAAQKRVLGKQENTYQTAEMKAVESPKGLLSRVGGAIKNLFSSQR